MQTARSKPLIELRPYQHAAMEAITRGFADYQRQLAVKPTGCHAAGHQILMADGRTKAVELIVVGDRVMGPDGAPRTVLELHQGRDEMFRIIPTKGEAFTVNAGHILHLRRTSTGKASEDSQPWACDISVSEYLGRSKNFKHLHKLERCAVEFAPLERKPWHIASYILGVAIGDGSLHKPNISICTPDEEIVRELNRFAHCIDSDIRVESMPDNKASNYFFKGKLQRHGFEFFRYAVRRMGLDVRCEAKFVPEEYKIATRHERLELLAGLLDTDGHMTKGGFEYSTKSLRLAEDVLFVARSLGLAAYQSEKVVKGQPYQRIYISGDCSVIPLRIKRKQASARGQIKSVLVTGFSVESADEGNYFGFTLDGDHLYLDSSFTVHHNSGKTVLFSALAQHYQPKRTLVLAHREELIDQAVDKIMRTTGLRAEVEMASSRASLDAPVVVASVQTLMREQRRSRWPRDHFGLVVVDEAHHSAAESYLSTLRHFDRNAFVLGVTATPDRGDKRSLSCYFQNIAFEITLLDLIKQGYLSPITVKTVPLEIDLDEVRTVAGDYSAEDLGHALDPYLEEIARHLCSYRRRKMLVFLPLISCSEKFAELCRRHGLAAEHVDGGSRHRKAILDRFSRGETTVLSNAMLLTEGYDEPSIDCVVCLRPTKVRSLYSQIVGRGTRIHPGKDHLLLLDFLWLSSKHSLIKPAHLIAADEEEAEEISEALFDQGGDLQMAQEAANADRTRNLVAQLRENRTRNSSTFDALEFALTLNDPSLARFEPTMGWHADKVTPKQTQLLAKFGIDPMSVMTKGHAALLLDRVFMRLDLKLATAKQVRWLRKLGHPKPELASFKEASEFLNQHFKQPLNRS